MFPPLSRGGLTQGTSSGPFLNLHTGKCTTDKQGPGVSWNIICLIRTLKQMKQSRCGCYCSGPFYPICRVKSFGACFGLDTLVTTGSGKQKLMKDLRIGEEVLSDETGSMTKVLGWLELNSKKKVSFLKINTHDAEELIMTGTHIVFHYEDGESTPAFIRDLKPGDVLVGGSGEVSTSTILLNIL